MEIGWPTDVRHVAHVTFDRFHGFLGLPVELEPEVPRRAPSASANVFGVSTESMQCSYDSRGNSIPTILLLMQIRLYQRGGLQAEGIFRINAENSQEELVRNQLNSGNVPDEIDVHCLAGLIKAWFRELPTGVLDSLTPEQVMQCQSEEDCAQLVRFLPPMEAALLDWAVNLMADVAQEEHINKMSTRNVAMVFAPNMSKNADPLTALMYAVQVMNFLKMLIEKALKARQDFTLEDASASPVDPSDAKGREYPQLASQDSSKGTLDQTSRPILDALIQIPVGNCSIGDDASPDTSQISHQAFFCEETRHCTDQNISEMPPQTDNRTKRKEIAVSAAVFHVNSRRAGKGISNYVNDNKETNQAREQSPVRVTLHAEKSEGTTIVTHINSRAESIEAWR